MASRCGQKRIEILLLSVPTRRVASRLRMVRIFAMRSFHALLLLRVGWRSTSTTLAIARIGRSRELRPDDEPRSVTLDHIGSWEIDESPTARGAGSVTLEAFTTREIRPLRITRKPRLMTFHLQRLTAHIQLQVAREPKSVTLQVRCRERCPSSRIAFAAGSTAPRAHHAGRADRLRDARGPGSIFVFDASSADMATLPITRGPMSLTLTESGDHASRLLSE